MGNLHSMENIKKKVLLINSGFRKKNTYKLLVQIGEILTKNGFETEILNLFDYEIKHCTGCDEVCVKKGFCSIKDDDMPVLMEKIIQSDGIIFGSPVYLNGVTSKLKTFIDRTNLWFHQPQTVGKPVFFALTTAVSGIKQAHTYIDEYATGLGVRKGGCLTRTHKNMNTPVSEKELSRFISLLNGDIKHYKPKAPEIIIFNVQKVLALKSAGKDNEFWQEKGWTDKPYYYKCKLGPKVLFSKMMFKILSKAIK